MWGGGQESYSMACGAVSVAHVKLNTNANNRNRKKTEKMLNEKKMLNDVVSETNIVKPDNKISFDRKESRHLCREIF